MWEPLLGLWWSVGSGLGLLCAVEGWRLAGLQPPRCERAAPSAMALGEWHPITLKLRWHGAPPLQVELHDLHPLDADVRDQPVQLAVPGQGWAETTYQIRPKARGHAVFGGVASRSIGPLQLLARDDVLGETTTVAVLPNFRAVARHALMAFAHNGPLTGVHLRRRRGQGLEFHQLREFRDGDSLRQVDWKSVSRRRQLISREFREERNQRVVFLLDCGRRMHARDGDASLLDRALDALLLLSYVALKQGDSVGLITFSGEDRWLPPVAGPRALRAVLQTVHDLHSSTAPSDYEQAARRLGARQPRRSLAVVLTNLRDDDSEDLPRVLAPLRRRHLVLVASLRDPAITTMAQQPVTGFPAALDRVAAQHHLAGRRAAHALLQGRGVSLLDVAPAELPAALVQRYAEIKRAGLL